MSTEVAAPASTISTHRSHAETVDVRWSDLDTLRHVNHAVIIDLISECRLRWMKGAATRDGAASFSDPLVVASLNLDFTEPVLYGTPVRVEMHIGRIGQRSFTVVHRALQEEATRAVAQAVVVPLGPDGRPRSLTPAERAYLTAHHPHPEGSH